MNLVNAVTPTHGYLLRSGTAHRRLLEDKGLVSAIRQLEPLFPSQADIIKTVRFDNMAATTQDIAELLRSQKSKSAFKVQEFNGRSSENAKEFLAAFKNYCELNKIDGAEKILTFSMCLSGSAKCWYMALSEDTKKDFELITAEFEKNYLQNCRWLNCARLESRKLLKTESAEKYIADMSDLALLVGIGDEELSKALIRGLPARLRWHVVSFNPNSLSETIQRILLGEATLSFTDREEMNVIGEGANMASTVQKVDERMDRLEDMFKSCQISKPRDYNDSQRPSDPRNNQIFSRRDNFNCNSCGMFGHRAANCNRRVQQPGQYGPQFVRPSYQPRAIRGANRMGFNRGGMFQSRFQRGRGGYSGNYNGSYGSNNARNYGNNNYGNNSYGNSNYGNNNYGNNNSYPKNGGYARM